LLFALAAVAQALLRRPDRAHQAAPWIYAAAALLMAILYAVSLHGFEEWTQWRQTLQRPASFLLLTLAGAVQTGIGLAARRHLRHRARLAVLGLVLVGLANVLAGLGFAGWEDTWPRGWWSPQVFGRAVPVAHLALPLASLAIALLACRFQMFTFLGLGLAGFATGVHLLGKLYFDQIAGWPKWVMLCGVVCFFGALDVELRRTRGRAADDTVTESRL
jgi:hypothetical protein